MELNIEKAVENGIDKALNEIELCIGMTLQEAVEKQIPQKIYRQYRFCPICDNHLDIGQNYCFDCGQALEWL